MSYYEEVKENYEVAKTHAKTLLPAFWMICRAPGPGYSNSSEPNPKKLYAAEGTARRAAEELARSTGHSFYLLKVVDVVRTVSPPTLWASEE